MTLRKYNPAFLSDSEIIDRFCVRRVEFLSLVETLRETEGDSNVHRIVIGPRGSGKTTLLLRVVAEVKRDPDLSNKFIALVLPEERYEVATAGEFWLECLDHLAHQVSDPDSSAHIRQAHEELRTIGNDRALNDLCVQTLVDFATVQGKRLLIVAENLNSMFDAIDDPDCGWRLRKILQTEPSIMLFASATSRFNEIDHPAHALYGFFDAMMLRRLSTEECTTLWANVSGSETDGSDIRPIEILTGGNPRLLAIAARFGGMLSFRALIRELLDLVDDHTEYFRSRLEALPPRERRVYLALAELWRPATCREVAEVARLSTSHCSAHIRRLIGRGAVQAAGGTPRRKEYYLTERMYNIYYLLRKRGGSSEIVQALIRFMASYYSAPEPIAERHFIGSGDHEGVDPAVSAVIKRSLRLEATGNTEAAINTLDELERIRRPTESKTLAVLLGQARLNKAALCTEIGDFRAAGAIATEAIDTTPPSSPDNVVRAYWIRAESRYRQGDISGCESDIKAALGWVVGYDARLQRVIRRLIVHAVRIGPHRILQLIEGSPATNVLSPLAAALRLDLGAAPRVAREVIEVARDVQRELEQVRLDLQGSETMAAQSAA